MSDEIQYPVQIPAYQNVLLSWNAMQPSPPPVDESTIEGAYEMWRREYGGFLYARPAWSATDGYPKAPTPREFLLQRGFTDADVDAHEARQEQHWQEFQAQQKVRAQEDRAKASMTVAKLIGVLQQLPGDMPVVTDDNEFAGNDCVDARVVNDDEYAGDVLLLTRFGEA